MKPSNDRLLTNNSGPLSLLEMFAQLFEYAGTLCHGNMVDQMVYDAPRKQETAE